MKFSNFKSIVAQHWIAILLSIIVGLVIVGPQLIFIYNAGNEYKGIYMFRSDAELHYLARMNESLVNGSLGNPFFYENYVNVPSSFYTISETILAFPAKIFNISIPTINLFYKFFLPFIIALLIYSFVFRLIKNRLWSITTMMLVMLGSALLNASDLIHFLKWDNIYGQFVIYSRPVNPEFSSILFFIYLHTSLSAFKRRSWSLFLWMAFLFGLSFYIYIYSFTFIFALNFVFFIIYLYKKDYDIAKKIILASIFGIGIGIFSIVNIFQVYKHSYFHDLSKISEITSSHAPILSFVGLISVCLFISSYLFRRDSTSNFFLFGLLLTAFAVVNQQILTGIVLQEGHYHWYFNIPIFAIIILISIFKLTHERYRKISISIALFICLISFSDAILIQSSTYKNSFDQSLNQNKYMVVLDWLSANTIKNSVVFADNTLSALVPVYTNNKVVWEDHAGFYLMSKDRREFTNNFLLHSFDNSLQRNKYKIDYVVWNRVANPSHKFDEYNFLKEVYKDDTFTIYAYQG